MTRERVRRALRTTASVALFGFALLLFLITFAIPRVIVYSAHGMNPAGFAIERRSDAKATAPRIRGTQNRMMR